MIKKVEFGVHPDAEAAGYDKMTTIIEITLKDGRTISGRADFGKGSPANPMSYDEVADKFRECAAYSRWSNKKSDHVVDLVRNLEALPNIRELTGQLTRAASRATQQKITSAGRAGGIRQKPARRARKGKVAKSRSRSR
jgi:2-methylcitrate dehydratase PrpD